MTSRARIVFIREGTRTRVRTAGACAPQRWTPGAETEGWLTVYHQLLGDGYFPADRCLAWCEVGPGARAVIEGIAATPLRAGAPSLAAVRLRVARGAALIYRPGPLLPHAGAVHGGALDAAVRAGGRLAVFQLLAVGRTAHEPGRFRRLVLRTRLTAEDTPLLDEALVVEPSDWPAGDPVVLLAAALGPWPASQSAWWEPVLRTASEGAASPLGDAGVLVRALFPSLGAANRSTEEAVRAMRNTGHMKICSSCRQTPETES